MIISRTPFRISFFGGGTDYPVWFNEHGGAVLATTIDKYCYISVRALPPFFDYHSRIVWSKIENVHTHEEIQHPAVKAVLNFLKIGRGVSIHHDADLPARSGIGSSSAFTAGLLKALYGVNGKMVSKKRLADEAIYVEQRILEESVGCQDQAMAAFGGLNHITFSGENEIDVESIVLPQERKNRLQDHLMLFFTGLSRTASDIAKAQVKATKDKIVELSTMRQMVEEGLSLLKGDGDLTDFGKLLHESWKLKKGLTNKISTDFIDGLYERARAAGAIGGKLLGAGGGGFFLVFARPEDQAHIKEALSGVLHVPFNFENHGSQIIFYDPNAILEGGDQHVGC